MLKSEEWMELSNRLEEHHALFYQMWQLGRPIFTDAIDTAAVQFNAEGQCVDFLFNPEFWECLNDEDRLFVIAHECLHVVLEHGRRTIGNKNPDKVNIRLDVVVNETLVNRFGFDRSKLSIADNACWVDTVFANRDDVDFIPRDESFEYYYQLDSKGVEVFVLDEHNLMSGDWSQVIDQLDKNMSAEEKEAIKGLLEKHSEEASKKLQRGDGFGGWTFVNVERVAPKRKWETVITEWSKKYLKDDQEAQEQWARLHRRYTMLPQGLFLPSEMDDDTFAKDRIPVFLFLDTSGSCYGFKERFWAAGMSLPQDKFDVRLFCFDTQVQETTLESRRIYGGGGTRFDIIEAHIQKLMADEGLNYPEAVFLITDGMGNQVNPQKPEKWYWFLTPHHMTHYIDPKCKKFNLKDFE